MNTNSKRKLDSEVAKTDSKHFKAGQAESVYDAFSKGLFDEENKESVKAEIASSGPYKHAVISQLMDDDLLRKVKCEIMDNLHFTKKETDIYKVYQTGDLRNLSGLDSSELDKLQNLFRLREALYSAEFRTYLSYVTGCGALSGTKQDLSINVYHKGCQLLTHDDVIGSRRISYILYLPDPDEKWQYPRWGGALRLYPTVKPNVPAKDWILEIPPAWNQLAFFTVQPGLSFHDVEEVFVDKPRVSISGWFHIPQKGEDGYIEGELEATEARSSLQQLESNEVQEYDFPKKNYEMVKHDETEQGKFTSALEKFQQDNQSTKESTPLDPETFAYLAKYMNNTLLKTPSMKMLSQYFCDESALEIRDFLNADYASVLRKILDKVDLNEDGKLPDSSSGVDDLPFWKLAGPPHKSRYMYIDGRESYDDETSKADDFPKILAEDSNASEVDKKLAEVSILLKSSEFRLWLRLISSLNPLAQRTIVRRFRPGLDYTLATSNTGIAKSDEESMVLEGTLCLTPTLGWADGELGGYELSMMGEDESDPKNKELDPAVYRGSSSHDGSTGDKKDQNDDDDAVLLTSQAEWNVLSLMVRDKGILKFVKYVSGNAPGSRWDIAAEWPVEVEEDDEEGDDESEA